MHPLWPELLQHLFHTRSETLRPWLWAIPAAERHSLWKQHKADLTALRKACQFSATAGIYHEEKGEDWSISRFTPRYPTLAPLRETLPIDRVADWITTEKVNICLAEDLYPFYVNLETTWAALADAKSAASLAKFKEQAPRPRWVTLQDDLGRPRPDAPESVLYSITQMLVLRDEPWVLALVQQAFDNYADLYGQGLCYAAVTAAAEHWPEHDWLPCFAKALVLEIAHYKGRLATLPLAHVLATLAWEPPAIPAFRRMGPAIITYAEVGAYLLQQAQAPATRAAVIDLILERLLQQGRPAQNQPWIKLWNQLEPTQNELAERWEIWLTLVNSPVPNALQLALQALKHLVTLADAAQAEALAPLLALNLSHPTQKIAKDSLVLLRAWHKAFPHLNVAPLLLPQLLTPHATVRQEMLKLFKGASLPDSAQTVLQDLLASGQLSPLEQEQLSQWVEVAPSPPVVPAAAPLPPADLTELSAVPEARRAWAESLQQALNGSTPSPLPPAPTAWAALPPFEPFPEPQALLDFCVAHARGPIRALDFERALISVLQLPTPADGVAARKYLDPLLKLLDKIDNPEALRSWNLPWHNACLAFLAQGWLTPGYVPVLHTPEVRDLFAQPWLATWLNKVVETLALRNLGVRVRLSQPDNLGGWIATAHFCQRLEQLPAAAVTVAELEQALYALAPEPRPEACWQQMMPLLPRYQPLLQQALTVALAPVAQAEAAAASWIQSLAADPPQGLLLVAEHGGVTFPDRPADHSLQLLCAALASRQVTPDWKPWPCLAALPIGQLRCDLGYDYTALSAQMQAQTEALQALGEEASEEDVLQALSPFTVPVGRSEPPPRRVQALSEWAPAMLTLCQQGLTASLALEAPPTDALVRALEYARFQVTLPHYRRLQPLLLWLQPKAWLAVDPAQHGLEGLVPLLWPCPGNAQTLFEVGVMHVARIQGRFGGMTRQEATRLWQAYYQGQGDVAPPDITWTEIIPSLDKQDFSLILLSLGLLPWIALAPALEVLLEVLTSKHAEHRERILALLDTGLRDGRMTPEQVVTGLADLLLSVSKGFSAVQDALTGWSNRDPLAELLVLAALERYFARLHPGLNAKVLSALLDQAHGLCRALGRGISDPEARTALTTLAETKKKTVGRDKAKLLLALPEGSENLKTGVLQRLLISLG